MTKDDIIKLAREAGFTPLCDEGVFLKMLEAFARAIEREIGFAKAELWLKRINDAVLAEREANQELLAALKALLADAEDCGGYSLPIHEKARAAIAKAERTTT